MHRTLSSDSTRIRCTMTTAQCIELVRGSTLRYVEYVALIRFSVAADEYRLSTQMHQTSTSRCGFQLQFHGRRMSNFGMALTASKLHVALNIPLYCRSTSTIICRYHFNQTRLATGYRELLRSYCYVSSTVRKVVPCRRRDAHHHVSRKPYHRKKRCSRCR